MRPLEPRVLRVLTSCRHAVVLLGGLGIVSGVLAIGQAFAVSLLVVETLRGQDFTTAALWTLGVLTARGFVAAVTQLVADRAGTDTAAEIRSLVIRRWLGQPVDARPAPARMLTGATSGASSVEPYVARYLPALISAAALPPLAILALVLTDWPSALIVVLTVPLLPVFAALIGKHTQESTQKRCSALTVLAGHFLDVMRGLPTLVSYQRADAQVRVVDEVGQKHRRATVQTLRIAFLSSAALELLATIAVAMVAVCVGLRLAWGTMPLRVALTAILLTPEAYWPIRRVGQEFHAAADGALALRDLLSPEKSRIAPEESDITRERSPIAPEESDITREKSPIAPEESVANGRRGGIRDLATLTYRYPAANSEILHRLGVPLSRGLTALVGPSGCGKTTALELLAGTRKPPDPSDRGSAVGVWPNDVAAGSSRGAQRGAHLVTQRPFLAPLTVRENLMLGAGAVTDLDLQEALEVTGLDGVLADLGMPCASTGTAGAASDPSGAIRDSSRVISDPSGAIRDSSARMGLMLGDEGFGLSAGQRALVALTRAVLSSAPILLLDEPTAHLDETVGRHIRAVLAKLAEDRTVIVATHDRSLIGMADRVVSLEAVAA